MELLTIHEFYNEIYMRRNSDKTILTQPQIAILLGSTYSFDWINLHKYIRVKDHDYYILYKT
jgi:hypothetical protein